MISKSSIPNEHPNYEAWLVTEGYVENIPYRKLSVCDYSATILTDGY